MKLMDIGSDHLALGIPETEVDAIIAEMGYIRYYLPVKLEEEELNNNPQPRANDKPKGESKLAIEYNPEGELNPEVYERLEAEEKPEVDTKQAMEVETGEITGEKKKKKVETGEETQVKIAGIEELKVDY
ncbi:hypothetical protein Dimus_022788 [Dionaea muscipula]